MPSHSYNGLVLAALLMVLPPVAVQELSGLQVQAQTAPKTDLKVEAEQLVKEAVQAYQQNDYQAALDKLQRAHAHYQKIDDKRGQATTLNDIGRVYDDLGDKQKALEYLTQALPLFKAVGDRSGEATTLYNIASVLSGQQQPALAIVFFKQSVNLTESLRNDIRGLPQEIQQTYTQTVADHYRRLADLLLQQDRVLEAQQVLDLLKVQELEDYLRNVRGNAQTAKGVDVLQPERQILAKYNELQKTAIQLGEEQSQLLKIPEGSRTPAQQQRIEQLVGLQREQSGQFNLFIKSPEIVAYTKQLSYEAQEQTVKLSQLNGLRDQLQTLNAVLLYPLILEDRLELVITTPQPPPLRRTVAVKRTELNQTIAAFRSALEDPNDPNLKPLAQKLYTWLIKPLEADLKQANAQTIIYAPDGQLRYIPLAALYDSQQWLVQRFRVNNITAASFTELTSRPPTQPRLWAGAFVSGTYNVQAGAQPRTFSGLTFAGSEVESLVALIPDSIKLIDQAFSLESSKKMNAYNIVHLATHAAFMPEENASFIVFGDGKIATVADIGTWSLFNVDLVVLSACQTGLGGELGNGEEILGLGYQFQVSGAKATIASLWSVDDGGTQVLMTAFYRALLQGKVSKAEALRQAQLALISGQQGASGDPRAPATISANPLPGAKKSAPTDLSHPYYWAPFILIGNGL
ncbi:MAG: CHAT domain-containing protein [Aphanocapsa sp. GSE-SYN-MK-11-07L]|jgi:CHAT domain-containing protein|nr:CHAT domain-containing protein [Aphanocapsa sp. GSE-SYN-MK-11-07L]